MKMEQAEYSETSAHEIQTPGNRPKEGIQHITRSFRYLVGIRRLGVPGLTGKCMLRNVNCNT